MPPSVSPPSQRAGQDQRYDELQNELRSVKGTRLAELEEHMGLLHALAFSLVVCVCLTSEFRRITPHSARTQVCLNKYAVAGAHEVALARPRARVRSARHDTGTKLVPVGNPVPKKKKHLGE